MNRKTILKLLFVILMWNAVPAAAQTTIFTHRGNLGFSANDNYDFEVKLYDVPTVGTGNQHGATLQKLNISVTGGDFTLQLDFGAAVFTGADRFLEIGWRLAGGGTFTVLSPRDHITSSPYAIRSASAATADAATTATQLGGLPASGFIQNTTSPQASTNFYISGNGVAGGLLGANIVNAATQFNLATSRILSGTSDGNLFVGIGSAASNTTGIQNAIAGWLAGYYNTTGSNNSLFGYDAGYSNVSGNSNSFFGSNAGFFNTNGSNNAFFGQSSGLNNTTASGNSFFGDGSGVNNNIGSGNAFFGLTTGGGNTAGSNNAFFGLNTGIRNTTGSSNTFIGALAGNGNLTSNENTMLGSKTNMLSGVSNATAIGANALVQQSNSLVLGSINGVNNATADTKVGIGTTSPFFRLHVIDPSNAGLRVQTNSAGGTLASFGGNGDFQIDAPGIVGGRFVVRESGNTGIGTAAPSARLHVRANSGNVLIGDAGCNPGFTGIGFGSSMSGCTNYSLLGDGTHTFINRPTGGSIFFRSGNVTQMSINVGGTVSINLLTGGGTTQLCRNPANEIATCSSSMRYKTNLAPFNGGLSLVNRLQPITFNWTANGEADLGLGAEDVAKVEPLLVTHNERGEVEGVKYDRIAVILLNAVKEQQQQIKQQAEQIQNQQGEIENLKRLACFGQPKADLCKAAARRVSANRK